MAFLIFIVRHFRHGILNYQPGILWDIFTVQDNPIKYSPVFMGKSSSREQTISRKSCNP